MESKVVYSLLVSLVALNLSGYLVMCFNVDLPSALTHRGPSGSYFGFSVDLHKDRGLNWLLVGAPTAQTGQPGVQRGGSVFRCSTELADQCEPIPFDVTGNNNASGQQIDQKSEQWFGATVKSAGPNGAVLACAPRYVWFSNNYKRREPVGTCFVARDSFREFSEYSPCRTTNWGYHRQGSCQAGLGASITPDGQRMFVGAVGSWYWQGQLFSQGLFSRLDVLSTAEGSASEDDSYLGYSSAVGDLDNDGKSDVAVGMPRGANLTGKVVMFTSTLSNIANLTGHQLGAYFGYCLTITDVDGDGLADVVVGSPLYTHFANTEGKFETGRVSVYYQTLRNAFRRVDHLDGEVTKARFGLSVAALGDINLDGFNDIAVGAPYDGLDERGAVYIFHGSSKGIRIKATQVIYAAEVSSELNTFGFSLAGGLDVDGNEYPDVLVGAYDSDRVVYLRSRPVVYLNRVDIFYEVESKQIDLDSRTCNLLDGTAVSCVQIRLCFEYTGRGVNPREDVNVQLTLDAKNPKQPRLHFLASEGRSVLNQTYALVKGQEYCQSHMVYIRPLVRDKLTPIESEVRYSLKESTEVSRRRNRRALPPVLGADTPTKSDVIHIQKNCGLDNVCIPDMQVTAKTNMDQYILGSGSRLEMEVSVLNAAEDAFEATLYLSLPAEVSFVKVERTDKDSGSILCSPPTAETGHVLRCDIGNPLPAYKTSVFTIQLQPNALLARENAELALAGGQKASSSLKFVLEVNSTNPEEPKQMFDNRMEVNLPIRVQTDLSIRGISDPDVVRFNLSAYTSTKTDVKSHENQVGPQVIHIYELGNRGPSDIVRADVYILWPTKTLSGKDLLYLVDRPFVDGPASCQLMEQFNPLALKLESERLSVSSSRSGSSSSSSSGGVSRSASSSSSSGSGVSRSASSSSHSSSSSSRTSSSSSGSSSRSSSSSSSGGSASKTTYGYSGSASSGSNTLSGQQEGKFRASNTGGSGSGSAGASSSSSWNRTSTVTRYNPDGTVQSSVTSHNSSPYNVPEVIEEPEEDEENFSSEDYSEEDTGSSSSHQTRIRTRRQTAAQKIKAKELDRELNCGATKCTVIKCTAGPLTPNNNVVFKLRARIWAQTIADIDWEDLVISSKMVVDITDLPFGVDPGYLETKSAVVTTTLDQLDREREAKAIPWWIIVLAAVAGILLLLLLIFILWKLGFFKRKRPDKDDLDQEPLKSENGHLQRDEHL